MATNTSPTSNIGIMPGLAPAGAALPTPKLDQLQISIWKGLNQPDTVLPVFKEHFGEPRRISKRKWLWWPKPGIVMRAKEKWAYQLIRFTATQPLLEVLTPILNNFPCKPGGKPAAQLRLTEVAWDFAAGSSYDEAEKQLRALAAKTMLNNSRARLRFEVPKCFNLNDWPECHECRFFHRCQRCRDGAANGWLTFYFQSLREYFVENEDDDIGQDENDDGYFMRQGSKSATFFGKIYCKQLAPETPWCIRFEVTLLGEKLETAIGRTLPADLTRLPRRLPGLCFDDFWRFERFDWPKFMKAAGRSADYMEKVRRRTGIEEGTPFAEVKAEARMLQSTAKHDGLAFTLWQKQVAKKVAKILGSRSLGDRIGAGEFSTRLKLEDVLPKSL